MSRISENIRKITRAWGGKTTGNGISDALSDLYNNLPFSVKKPLDYKFMPEGYPKVEIEMVEIVPEQSVTGYALPILPNSYVSSLTVTKNPMFIGGNKYTVLFNNQTYSVIATEELTENGDRVFIIGNSPDSEDFPFSMSWIEVNDSIDITWSDKHPETITLAIYEEQEVVQPIDPKFVGASGGGVFVVNVTYDGETFSADKTLSDIETAVSSGQLVFANGGGSVYPLSFYMEGMQASFSNVDLFMGDARLMQIVFSSDGTITRESAKLQQYEE